MTRFPFRPRHETLLTNEDDRQLSPWAIERAMRKARREVKGLPAGFRYHDYADSCLMPMPGRSSWSAVVSGLKVSA